MAHQDSPPLDTYGETAHRVDEIVGEEIRRRRLQLGVTQEQLARFLRVSYQQVQKYEAGSTRLSAGRLYEIAGLLNCEVSHLFDPVSQSDDPTFDLEPLVEEQGKNISELLQSYSRLNNSEIQTAVLNLMRSLNRRRGDA